MTKAPKITLAVPSEAGVLTEIAFTAKRHWGYPDRWMDYWRTGLTITQESVAARGTYAARAGEKILGFMALGVERQVLCLRDLWVRPVEMGRGVGRALFRHAQQRGWDLGFDEFEIESDPHAAGFYERMGAEQTQVHTSMLDGKERELPIFCCRTTRGAEREE